MGVGVERLDGLEREEYKDTPVPCHTSRTRAAKPSRVSAAITQQAASDN